MNFKLIVEEMLLKEQDDLAAYQAWSDAYDAGKAATNNTAPSNQITNTQQTTQAPTPPNSNQTTATQQNNEEEDKQGPIDTIKSTIDELLNKDAAIRNNLNKFIKVINNNNNLDINNLNASWYKVVYDGVLNRQNISRWLETDIYPYFSFIDFIVFCYSNEGTLANLNFKVTPKNVNAAKFADHIKQAAEGINNNNPVLYYTPYSVWLKSVDVEIKRMMLDKDGESLGFFFIKQCIEGKKTVLQTITEAVSMAENKTLSEKDIRYVLNNPLKNTNVPKSKSYLASIAKSLFDINNPQ
jgi:hypothetical protein